MGVAEGISSKRQEYKNLGRCWRNWENHSAFGKDGYSVTLCDISPRMLDVARQKMLRERVLDRVRILECDIRNLDFDDASFDFVLCWNGAAEAAKELVRVTKKGGKISLLLVNRCGGAIDLFAEDPALALELINSRSNHIKNHEQVYRLVSELEGRKLLEAEGIRVLGVYAVCGWMDFLHIEEKAQNSHDWDEQFFKQTAEMVIRSGEESSVKGMSRHLVLYGEKM